MGVTVTVAEPLVPPLAAAIVADPAATPVTRPLELTVATELLLLDHVIARPVRMLPLPSLRIAVAWSVAPTATLVEARLTVTDATGTGVAAATVMVALPLLPSLVAVIVAVPAARPVTRPPEPTEAIEELLVDQLPARPVSVSPLASLRIAVAWSVPPTVTLGDARLTVTVATGTGVTAATVTVDAPFCPPLVAVIVADPPATPVTSPLPSTVATAGSLLDQLAAQPVSTLPVASCA